MTYLLNFRALCDSCEKAEACLWCIQDHCALCKECDEKVHIVNRISQRHERVEVVPLSVLSTLCNECNVVPASFYHEGKDMTLCELCEKKEREGAQESMTVNNFGSRALEKKDRITGSAGPSTKALDKKDKATSNTGPSIIPLHDAHVTESIVFEKMDFTSCFAVKKHKSRRSARLILAGLGAQETPESKVDRWLHRTQAPGWTGDPESQKARHAERQGTMPSTLPPFVPPSDLPAGSKRSREPTPVLNSYNLKEGGGSE